MYKIVQVYMNYINLIQEYYQKSGIKPITPTYTFDKGGEDHRPSWTATVTLFDGQQFSGSSSLIKNKAKLSAAEQAYSHLYHQHIMKSKYSKDFPQSESTTGLTGLNESVPFNGTFFTPVQPSSSCEPIEHLIDYHSISKLILVDLENCPQGVDLRSTKDMGVLGFLSHSHSLYEKLPLEGIKSYVIKSTRKDAADQYMVFMTSKILYNYHSLLEHNNCIIKILSKDNYAGVLCDIIRQEYKDLRVEHITSLKDV